MADGQPAPQSEGKDMEVKAMEEKTAGGKDEAPSAEATQEGGAEKPEKEASVNATEISKEGETSEQPNPSTEGKEAAKQQEESKLESSKTDNSPTPEGEKDPSKENKDVEKKGNTEEEIKEEIASEEKKEEVKKQGGKEDEIEEEDGAKTNDVMLEDAKEEGEKEGKSTEEEIHEDIKGGDNEEAKKDEEEDEEEEEDEDEEEEAAEDEDLEELMYRAREERRRLNKGNASLQKQIQAFWEFDRRSQIELKEYKLTNKGTQVVSGQKANYLKALKEIKNTVMMIQDKAKENQVKIEKAEQKLDLLDEKASSVNQAFKTFKREIAVDSVDQQTGKPLKFKRILAFESTEAAKDKEVEDVRLTNIHYVKRLAELVNQVRKNEELDAGLSIIDFEQLKIENQTLSEKVEERNDELHKLIKKKRSTVEVLTHIKEKLQFVQAEEQKLRKKLETLVGRTGKVTTLLDKVIESKRKRDAYQKEFKILQGQAGFVGSDVLVSDYEKRRLTNAALREKLEELQNKHAKTLAVLKKYKPSEVAKFSRTVKTRSKKNTRT